MQIQLNQVQPTKNYKFKKEVEGYTEERHIHRLGNLVIETEFNYVPDYNKRTFSYAFAWTISLGNPDQILVHLNMNQDYRNKSDTNLDLKTAKKIASFLHENPEILAQIVEYTKQNGPVKI